jgi:hypothetical protein
MFAPMRAVCVALMLGAVPGPACLSASDVPCGDRVCPGGSTCYLPTQQCIPSTCGNGTIEGGEQCDGDNLAGQNCQDLGFYEAASLSCSPICTLDTAMCVGRCGDHITNGTEICDGSPPIGDGCLDYGFDLGRIGCTNACSPAFDHCAAIGWPIVAGDGVHILYAVWGTSESDAFAVGQGGTVLHYNGTTWTAQASGTSSDLHGVWSASATSVFAVGDGGAIIHFDGTNWSPMTSNTTASLLAVWGASASDIYAVGSAGTILHYDGTTWSVTTWPTTLDLSGVYGDGGTVVIVGATPSPPAGSLILRKVGGASWVDETVDLTGYHLNAVWGGGGTFVAVGGVTGSLDSSTIVVFDGGAWTKRSLPVAGSELYSVWGASATDIVVGGFAGYMMRGDGQTFAPMRISSTRLVSGLWGTSASNVLATSTGGYVLRHDGIAWAPAQDIGIPSAKLIDVWRYANGDLLVVGEQGQVYSVQDGVTTSIPIAGALTDDVQGIWDSGDGTTFVATAGSGVRKRGPADSSFVSCGLDALVYDDVWGTSATNVFAVGGSAVTPRMRRYNGSTWTTPTFPPGTGKIIHLWGSGPADIYAATSSGGLLHTTDGDSWTAVPGLDLPPTVALRAVWGTSATNVYAAGDAGTILHYDGIAWRHVSYHGSDVLLTIDGTSPDDIFIGGTGVLIHYDGTSWSRMAMPDLFSPIALAASSAEVDLVGRGGAVLPLTRACSATEERCGDPWDNDCDGAVNCDDADCAGSPECARGGACSLAATLTCNTTVVGTTFSGAARIDDLPCLPAPLTGSEAVYRIEAPSSGTVTLTLDAVDGDAQLAVLPAATVGTACDLSSCIAGSEGTVSTPADGEPLYLIVDAPGDAGADFTLTVQCE